MKIWVWRGEPLPLRIVVLAVAAALALLALFELANWLMKPKVFGLALLAALQLALAYGMLRMFRWARMLAVLGLWFSLAVAVVAMIGVINPFTAMDLQAAGRELPHGGVLLAAFAVPIAAILWFLHVLGKYKDRFGRAKAEMQASSEGAGPDSERVGNDQAR